MTQSKKTSNRVQVNLPDGVLDWVDTLVKEGWFTTRQDAIRVALMAMQRVHPQFPIITGSGQLNTVNIGHSQPAAYPVSTPPTQTVQPTSQAKQSSKFDALKIKKG